MSVPPWLDRLWLWLVGIAFVVIVPIKIILWVEDFGWFRVAIGALGLFLLGMVNGWPTASRPPMPADSQSRQS